MVVRHDYVLRDFDMTVDKMVAIYYSKHHHPVGFDGPYRMSQLSVDFRNGRVNGMGFCGWGGSLDDEQREDALVDAKKKLHPFKYNAAKIFQGPMFFASDVIDILNNVVERKNLKKELEHIKGDHGEVNNFRIYSHPLWSTDERTEQERERQDQYRDQFDELSTLIRSIDAPEEVRKLMFQELVNKKQHLVSQTYFNAQSLKAFGDNGYWITLGAPDEGSMQEMKVHTDSILDGIETSRDEPDNEFVTLSMRLYS